MLKFISRFKTGLVGVLLLILSAYYVNSSMFYHQHVIEGETIFHSHFNSEEHTSNSEDGGHTVDVIKLIAALSNIAIEEQSFQAHIEAVERTLECVALARPTAQATLFLDRITSLRAPPATII